MPIILDQALYNRIRREADKVYDKPSAYKSGYIVKQYKAHGGKYADDNKPKNLGRWFQEEWGDIGGKEYPVYRPHKRINSHTPLTADEIDPRQAKKQIELKQVYKGEHNLPKFQAKGFPNGELISDKYDENDNDDAEGEGGGLLPLPNIPKTNEIWKWSNPTQVRKMATKYLGKNVPVYLSNKKGKKYMVQDPQGKWVHFGQLKYEDYTHHHDDKRRSNYLTRTANMKGNWRDNKYSANNLSRNILW